MGESCELTPEVQAMQATLQQQHYGPDFQQTARCPPPEWIPLLCISIVLWFITLGVSWKSARRFDSYRWSKTLIYTMSRRVIYYYVACSLLNIFTIINAKAAILYSFANDCVEAMVMINFYYLIWAYTGGIEETLKKLIGLDISLGQPPCCCLRFMPMVKINERFIMIIEMLLLQLPVVQFLCGLINITLVTSGIPDKLFSHWSTTLLMVIMTISAMASIYAIGMLYACWAQFVVGRRVAAKFAVFKITIVLSKVQELVFKLSASGAQSAGFYKPHNRVELWNAFLVTVECCILAIIASFLYKRSDYDTPNSSINYRVNKDDKEDSLGGLGNGDMEEVDLGKPSLVIQNPNI